MGEARHERPDYDPSLFPPTLHVPCLTGAFEHRIDDILPESNVEQHIVELHLLMYMQSVIHIMPKTFVDRMIDFKSHEPPDRVVRMSVHSEYLQKHVVPLFRQIALTSISQVERMTRQTIQVAAVSICELYWTVHKSGFPKWFRENVMTLDKDMMVIFKCYETMSQWIASVNLAISTAVDDRHLLDMWTKMRPRDTRAAFIVACAMGREVLFQTLVVLQDENGLQELLRIGLHIAIRRGHAGIVRRLIRLVRADANDYNDSFLIESVEFGNVDVVAALLADSRSCPSKHKCLALAIAASKGSTDIIALLLNQPKVDASVSKSWPLRIASQYGHAPAVTMILAMAGVNPRHRSSEALWRAAANGHEMVVDVLLKDGRANPRARNSLALLLAAAMGHIPVVRCLLIDGRADPVACDNAALKAAIVRQSYQVVELLIANLRVRNLLDASFAFPPLPPVFKEAALRISRECGDVIAEMNWSDPDSVPHWSLTNPNVLIRLMRAGVPFLAAPANRWQESAVKAARVHLRVARERVIRQLIVLFNPRSSLQLPRCIREMVAMFWIDDHNGLLGFTHAERKRDIACIGRIIMAIHYPSMDSTIDDQLAR